MATFGNTLDAVTLDPTTGLPAPGVPLYVWADETGGAPLLSLTSGDLGAFGWEYDTDADGLWVSAGMTGPRVYVPNNDALTSRATTVYVDERLATKANASTVGAISAKVDTTETRVGDVEDEVAARLRRDQRPAPVLTDKIRALKGGGIGVGTKAVVALRFDDWQAAFKANVYALLKARGLPAGYTHISRLDQQPDWTAGVTWADVKDWWKNGVEVWSHGTDHKDPTPAGYAGLVEQIVTSKAELEAQGLPVMGWMQPGATPLTAATPYGTTWTDLADFANTDAGRLITATYGLSMGDTVGKYRVLPTNVAHGLAHFTVTDGATLAQAKQYVDNAIAAGMGVQLMSHVGNLGKPGNMTLADYTALLDYIVTKRDAGLVEVLTPSGLAFANRTTTRQNLLLDGSFTTSLAGTSTPTSPYQGWVAGMTVETSGGHTGPNFLRFTNTVTGTLVQRVGGAYNPLGVQQMGFNGGTMVAKVWARSNGSATTTARFLISDYDDASRLSLDVTRPGIGTSWTQLHIPFSLPRECNRLTFALGRTTGDGIDFDDLEIVAV